MAKTGSLLRVRPRRVAAPLPLAAALLLRTLAVAPRRRRVGAADRDLAAVREPYEAGGDHAFGRIETRADHRLRLILLLHSDRPYRDRVVILDDINKSAVRAPLNRAGRNHHDLLEGVDQQPDIDELPGPELQLGVGKFRLELHGAGRLIDLIVNDPEHAMIDHGIVVGSLRVDIERSFVEGRVHLRKVLLRKIEQHRYRLQLRDHDYRRAGVGRAYIIAFIDHTDAGAAVDRRGDGRVAEHRRGVVDRRLIGLHQRGVLRHQCALRIGLLFVDRGGGGESFVAVKINLRVRELRFVLRLLGHRLSELRLIDDGVDLGQQVTLLDVVAFLEVDAEKFAVDLRAH